MNRPSSISTPARRLEALLACLGVLVLVSFYAATIGALRIAIALGWYVS